MLEIESGDKFAWKAMPIGEPKKEDHQYAVCLISPGSNKG